MSRLRSSSEMVLVLVVVVVAMDVALAMWSDSGGQGAAPPPSVPGPHPGATGMPPSLDEGGPTGRVLRARPTLQNPLALVSGCARTGGIGWPAQRERSATSPGA